MWRAAAVGDPVYLRYCIDVEGGPLDARNAKGLTPLHVACLHMRVGCVEFLLRRGADPRKRMRPAPIRGHGSQSGRHKQAQVHEAALLPGTRKPRAELGVGRECNEFGESMERREAYYKACAELAEQDKVGDEQRHNGKGAHRHRHRHMDGGSSHCYDIVGRILEKAAAQLRGLEESRYVRAMRSHYEAREMCELRKAGADETADESGVRSTSERLRYLR